MHIDLITLFPEMFTALDYGIVGRAKTQHHLHLTFWNPRDFTQDKHRRVDDSPYGGGPGMVMQVQPLRHIIQAIRKQQPNTRVIYLSPQGKVCQQHDIQRFSTAPHLTLLCGRYEGIDQRIIDYDIDEEWSIGNYILSGGEFAAMVMIDAMVRLLPETLGDPQSAIQDSFSDGLLDFPHYTRPASIDNQSVPSVLLSGNHADVAEWRLMQALGNTWLKRPDLLAHRPLSRQEQQLLECFITNYNKIAS